MKIEITRRDFLKATMAGAVSLSAASLLGGCDRAAEHLFAADTVEQDVKILTNAGFTVDQQTVEIEGLQKEYRLIFVNDLHIVIPNEEVSEEAMPTVMDRYEKGHIDANGVKAYALWDTMVDTINQLNIDAVILNGDMIDYFTHVNFGCLREGCEKLAAPFMYVRADHDYSDSYNAAFSQELVDRAERLIDSDDEVFCMDFDEFMIVGVSRSTSPISDAAVEELSRLFGLGKPIVLVNHVPYDSLVDTSLNQASKEVWQGMALLWGYQDTLYETTGNVQKMLDLLYAEDSPVAAVFGGHLHFTNDVMLTQRIRQHVFDAAFRGTIGYVVVKGSG